MAFSSSPIAATGKAATGLDDGVTTDSVDTTGANLIVLSGDGFGDDAVACSDNKSNTWLSAVAYDADSNRKIKIFYVYSPTVGSGHTFTLIAPRAKSLSMSAWSGAASSPLDQTSAGGNNGAASATFTVGSITPPENDELVIVAMSAEGTTDPPFSINGGFTMATNVAGVTAASFASGMAYLVQTSAAASNPTVTSLFGIGAYAYGVQASFKAAGGGGGATWPGYISPFGWN